MLEASSPTTPRFPLLPPQTERMVERAQYCSCTTLGVIVQRRWQLNLDNSEVYMFLRIGQMQRQESEDGDGLLDQNGMDAYDQLLISVWEYEGNAADSAAE